MNIAYVHSGLWPSNSPSMTFASMTAWALAQEGKNCHFYIRRNSDHSSREIYTQYFETPVPENLHVHQGKPKRLLNTNRFYFQRVYKSLAEKIKLGQIDAVITRNVTFLPWLVRLKKQYKIQAWYESHDFFANPNLRDDLKKPRKKQMLLEKKYIPRINGIICLQKAQIELYRQCFPNTKFILARTGIIGNKAISKTQGEYIGYVGSLDHHKGVDVLIEAAARSKTQPRVLIIGGKNQSEKIRFLETVRPDFQDRIVITGWLQRKALEEEMAKIRIGIVPLRDTFFNRYLTSPLKIFDFYAAGIPVIAPDFPTMQELIDDGKTGLLFEPHNAKQLAEKIDRLFVSEDDYAQMKQHVNEKAQSLLWTERAKTLIHHFQETADAA